MDARRRFWSFPDRSRSGDRRGGYTVKEYIITVYRVEDRHNMLL